MAEENSKEAISEDFAVPTEIEKKPHRHDAAEMNADGEYLVNAQVHKDEGSDSSVKELRMTKDGKTALIPQPSDDPKDPLNWSWAKKHKVLVALTFSALL